MEKRCHSRMMLGQFWLSVRTSCVAVTKPRRRIERRNPTRVEGRQIDRARGSVRDQLGHRLAGSRCVEDAPDAMAGGDIGALDPR